MSTDHRDSGAPAPLLDALGAAGLDVVVDPEVLAGYATDWTGRWEGPVLAAVRPRSTEQVAAVLAAARAVHVPVQVQGGNTGLVGGSVPDRPALLLLTGGLDLLGTVDPVERTVVVGAGVPLARLAEHARDAGLRFGVDLAARDSATVGGLAATNAGGIGVCAHGMMRDNVRGLTAVLADGRIVRTAGRPRKDNSGYDLAGLLVGGEGTLGVITEVEVALIPPPPPSSVGLLAVADLAAAVAAARSVQDAGSGWLLAAEVVDAPGVARAAAALGLADPMPPGVPWLLLLEIADGGTAEGFAGLADAVVAVATRAADRARLWAYRERQTECYAALPGPPVDKLDIGVRLDRLDEVVRAIRSVAEASARGEPAVPGGSASDAAPEVPASDPGAPDETTPWVGFFGHALDGNLHVQLVGAPPGTAERVLDVVGGMGGSISAEHGIGRLKAHHLSLARSAEEIDWMRQLRATVDPDHLLNPGVLFAD